MSQSLSKNNIHLVFSTKNRENLIPLSLYPSLRAYLIDVLSSMRCYTIEFGGTENHVHILMVLNKNIALSMMVNKLKSNTSRWMHERGFNDFGWQIGYGVFSVSESRVAIVQRYIQRQVEHHRDKMYQDEVREIFVASGIEWDERYVWD